MLAQSHQTIPTLFCSYDANPKCAHEPMKARTPINSAAYL